MHALMLISLLFATPDAGTGAVTVRTEVFARPPYSGATYFLYERDGAVICTKLSVCNKFNQCETTYQPGLFRDEESGDTGAPFSSTEPVLIPREKLTKHVCLTRFKLVPGT